MLRCDYLAVGKSISWSGDIVAFACSKVRYHRSIFCWQPGAIA